VIPTRLVYIAYGVLLQICPCLTTNLHLSRVYMYDLLRHAAE